MAVVTRDSTELASVRVQKVLPAFPVLLSVRLQVIIPSLVAVEAAVDA